MKKILLFIIATALLLLGIWWAKNTFFGGMAPQVIHQDGFQANYFNKGDETNKTAVVLIGGGDWGDFWASELAKMGHVGLSLPYHRREGLPPLIEKIPLEYVEKALNWLAQQPSVNPDKIIVMGASVNAELALLVASTFPKLASGVIAYCPSSVTWSNTVYPWSSEEVMAKWTHKGQPVPYIAMEKLKGKELKGNETNVIETLSYWNTGLDDSAQVAQAAIPVERIAGPILLLTPADDKVWPSHRMSQMIVDRLEAHHFSHAFDNIIYKNAGHTITAQHSQASVTTGQMYIEGIAYEFEYGGTPEGILKAQKDSRERVKAFVGGL